MPGSSDRAVQGRSPYIVPDEQLHFYRLCGTSMYSNVLGGTVQTVLAGAVHSHVPTPPAGWQIFSYKWGAAGWGEQHTLCLTGVLL